MNQNYLAEMYKLTEKARTLDRLGKSEEALKIYLEIHEKYFPNTSDLYERPAILLEKYHRYEEALTMLEKALQLIEEGKITGVKDNFVRRIDRVKGRLSSSEPQTSVKTAPDFNFNELIQKFRHLFTTKGLLVLGIIAFAIIGLVLVSQFYAPQEKYSVLDMDMEQFRHEAPADFFEKNKNVEPEDLPVITPTMIDMAVKSASNINGVININLIAESDVIGVMVLLAPDTDPEVGKNAIKTALQTLSKEASKENDNIPMASPLSYGGLYDYYYVIAAVTDDYESIMLKGYKRAKAKDMTWKEGQ